MAPTRTLVFGYGYLGRRVADLALAAGDDVWVTTRSDAKIRQLESSALRPLKVDWNDRRTMDEIPPVDRVLVAVAYDPGPSNSGQLSRDRFASQVGGLDLFLNGVSPSTDVCYISTTGVYHQTDGSWVDERSPTHPRREGGRVHLAAESLIRRRRPDGPGTILRLAGIYGPGRVPRAADVIAGRPIASPADGFLNLIHVDDAAAAVMAAWSKPSRSRVFVVGDDQPMVRADFYREIARQCGSPSPTFVDPSVDAPDGARPVRMRSDSNKRIWNRRMRRELLPRMTYPTYREGLRQVLGSQVLGSTRSS